MLRLAPDIVREVACGVDIQLFHNPRNRFAFEVLQAAAIGGGALGMESAIAAIEQSHGYAEYFSGNMDDVRAHLDDCCTCADPPSSWKQYVGHLRVQHARKVLTSAFDEAALEAASATTVDEAMNLAVGRVIDAAGALRPISAESDRTMADMVDEYMLDYMMGDASIPFPQQQLNTIGGVRPGNVVILSAYTGHRKTWTAIDWALWFAREQAKRVSFYNLEMSEGEIMERLMASVYGLDLEKIVARAYPPTQLESLAAGLQELPMRIVSGSASPSKIITDIAGTPRAERPEIVFIDHMHLLSLNVPHNQYRQALNDALTRLKGFALDNKIIFVLVAQLARPERRTGELPIPSMYMLKESGAIEQIADYIIFIHRLKETVMGYEQVEDIMWTEKQRQGQPAERFTVQFRDYRYR